MVYIACVPMALYICLISPWFYSVRDAEKCLLGLHAHQGRYQAEKKIPTAFCVDDIGHAALIRESLRWHGLATRVTILKKAKSEGWSSD